jgi:hypothetical protein
MMLDLAATLDASSQPSRTRQALRLLAAGMMARQAGVWSQGLRHLGAALRRSSRTVLAGPNVTEATRLLLPLGFTKMLHRLLATADSRVTGRPPGLPLVTAVMHPNGHRGP